MASSSAEDYACMVATKECNDSYGKDGVVDANGNDSNQDHNGKGGSDLEVGPSKTKSSMGKDDPFGDETNSGIKYRSMAWWSVESPKRRSYESADWNVHRQAGLSMELRFETIKGHRSLITSTVMIAETISLGILSLPSVLAAVGIVP